MIKGNLRGRIHKDYSPFTTIGDLEDFARKMVGKPVTIDGIVIGKITDAEVCGDYIDWESMPFHSLRKTAKVES